MTIDRWFYGTWTLVVINFLKFNVVGGLGSFFGVHAWHWFFSQGLPTILFTYTPLFILGCIIVKPQQRTLLWLLLWDTLVHSLIAHKEFRFKPLPNFVFSLLFVAEGYRCLGFCFLSCRSLIFIRAPWYPISTTERMALTGNEKGKSLNRKRKTETNGIDHVMDYGGSACT